MYRRPVIQETGIVPDPHKLAAKLQRGAINITVGQGQALPLWFCDALLLYISTSGLQMYERGMKISYILSIAD
jgi:hypothetical protein